MFGFMKKHADKDREERKRREKRDKKEKKKGLTPDELTHLDDVKRGLWRRLSDTKQPHNGRPVAPSSLSSGSAVSASTASTAVPADDDDGSVQLRYTSYKKMELSSGSEASAASAASLKKGILKEKSHYGPEIPNQGVHGELDDTLTLEENTHANEDYPGEAEDAEGDGGADEVDTPQSKRTVRSMVADMDTADADVLVVPRKTVPQRPQAGRASGRHAAKPTVPKKPPKLVVPADASPPPADETSSVRDEDSPPSSPVQKTYPGVRLPPLAAPCRPPPRDISLRRQAAGDFGFDLRRGAVLERDAAGERCRAVIFAEPGPRVTGLLPGDRLVGVNGAAVDAASRADVIEMIRRSGDSVLLRVQPIPELSELSAGLVARQQAALQARSPQTVSRSLLLAQTPCWTPKTTWNYADYGNIFFYKMKKSVSIVKFT